MFQCGGGTIASAAVSHTGASNADLIALETVHTEERITRKQEGTMPIFSPLSRCRIQCRLKLRGMQQLLISHAQDEYEVWTADDARPQQLDSKSGTRSLKDQGPANDS